MSSQLSATPSNPLRPVLRVLFMLAVPLAGFALFGGNIHVTNAASTYVIQMKDYQYQSEAQFDNNGDIDVPLGATVEWTNNDPDSHDVAILEGPALNVSPEVKAGQSWSMTFTIPGTYHYYCEFHPSMVANVVVGGSDSTAPVGRSVQTFAETGKTVRGLFLDYWNTHGGLAQQGFPIS
ncbi:MAG TPA: plastocyanin/azurin family copper-binding protein, partial [Chloroflexia bacterium]|nr:plastocyanin/azurin family copper-binding protein [Chloroflexia bacterium]